VIISYVKIEGRPSLWMILCEGEPWREVHAAIFGRRLSFSKSCQTKEDLEEEFARLEYQYAKVYAVKRLALQGMLSSALARSLTERLVSKETTERLIEEFLEQGLLNDESWAASFVRTQKAKKMGPRAITQKLAHKGVRGEILKEAVHEAWNAQDQEALIRQLLKTRYARRNLSDYKERQKVVASLVRRGFDLSAILGASNGTIESESETEVHGYS
jgi:regulatory protein